MLVLPGLILFGVASTWVGLRLVLLWWSTRQLPELLIGIAFLASGAVGFALQILAQTEGLLGFEDRPTAMAAGKLCVQLGVGCQALFTWQVFRRKDTWAHAFALALLVALAAVSIGYGTAGQLGNPVYSGLWFWLEVVFQMLAAGWGAVESLRYYAAMRRRLRIGLVDPVLANRFLLWGLAIGAGVAAIGVGGLIHAVGVETPYTPFLIGLAGTVALISAVGYWLTFFPPAAYLRLVKRRAAAELA